MEEKKEKKERKKERKKKGWSGGNGNIKRKNCASLIKCRSDQGCLPSIEGFLSAIKITH